MDDLLLHITPTWLTDVLRTHGHLADGHVTQIDRTHTSELMYSRHLQFVATYSRDVPSSAPTHLFLKIPRPQARSAALREITFYTELAPRGPAMPLVPYYASGTLAGDTPFLLLGDVSPTHYAWNDGLPPRSHINAIIGVLARIHSDWWQSPYLKERFSLPSDEVVADLFVSAPARYAELTAQLGSQLTATHRQIFERYLDQAPRLFRERLDTGRALTLCHPDNHHANFLFPRHPDGDVYVIDWHVYRRWWGLIDIVALITRSVALEQPEQADELLRSYHHQLMQCGVTDYSWDACWDDYRLSVIDTLRVILNFASRPDRALQNLGPIMGAFEQCRCDELFA